MAQKFYITTAIPYVNAPPHIGHALEFVQGDVVARYQRQQIGEDNVLLLSGADENALKNVQAAEKAGKPVQEFVDENAEVFQQLASALNVKFSVFQKGSDQKTHFASSQKLWELCDKNGDIYKKEYTGLYCVGCEMFYERAELNEKGECFEHPGKKLEEVSETNYFFKLSRYQDDIIKLITSDQLKIIPATRKNEVLAFLKEPLRDISISRTNERAKNWGVPVPDDLSQRMYVWFDALNIYQSGIGFVWDEKTYEKWWPADVHVIGKGIIRFHAVYWPAFLMSAKLPLPKELFAHGYITVEGQKMSKSVGNVVDPFTLIDRYGVDAVRYYLLREIPSYGDGDYSERRFKEVYNADLANGLGNLVARVAKLCEKNNVNVEEKNDLTSRSLRDSLEQGGFYTHLNTYEFNLALEELWREIKTFDKDLDDKKPWLKSKVSAQSTVKDIAKNIKAFAYFLTPFLPQTAEKIQKQFTGAVQAEKPLFPRIP